MFAMCSVKRYLFLNVFDKINKITAVVIVKLMINKFKKQEIVSNQLFIKSTLNQRFAKISINVDLIQLF